LSAISCQPKVYYTAQDAAMHQQSALHAGEARSASSFGNLSAVALAKADRHSALTEVIAAAGLAM
jgi:hypothetical protein